MDSSFSGKAQLIYKYIFFALAAFIFLSIATRSSFLYPFNNWDDANSYLTMGKSLFSGRVLYRDVFDQKGMYLYFLYGLAYLISHTAFTGVFILEILLAIADMAGFYHIIALYLKDKEGHLNEPLCCILSSLTYALLISSRSFWWGGSAEEVLLPFLVFGLYLSLRYFKCDYPERLMDPKTLFIGGILAGVVANIKYTALGLFFSFMMFVFISYVIKGKVLDSLKACLIFLGGMAVPFVPWFIYFAVNGALYEWYWGYVYVNVFVYSEASNMGASLGIKVYNLTKLLYNLILDNLPFFIPAVIGLIYAFFEKGIKLLSRLNVAFLFCFLYLGIFGGGRTLPYYSLPLSVFAVLGAAALGKGLLWAYDKLGQKGRNVSFPFAGTMLVLSIFAGALFIYFNSMNTGFMKEKKEDFFLYRFRDDILSENADPTILNIGCLDAGLYTLCDSVPVCRYFQTQTLHIEDKSRDPYHEQDRYVSEAMTDYIIARDSYPDDIFERYDLIDSEDYGWDGLSFTYYLFKKKPVQG